MRSRLVLAVAGLALLALLMWSVLGRGQESLSQTADEQASPPAVAGTTAAIRDEEAATVPSREAAAIGAVIGPELPSWDGPPDRDHDLHGIVVGPDEERIAGAEVIVRRAWARDIISLDLEYYDRTTVIAATRSSANGEFRVPLPPYGLHDLDVRCAGLIAPLVRDCRAGEYVFVRLVPAAALHGKLAAAADGAPIPGLAVRLFRLGGNERTYRTQTGPDGGYRFEGLAAGEWNLEVLAQQHESPPWTKVLLSAGQELEQSFRLEQGRVIRGRVVEAGSHMPIAEAELSDNWTFHRAARANDQGWFEVRGLDLGQDWSELHVRAPGYGRRGIRAAELRLEAELEIELTPALAMHGILLGADGTPARGAYVALIGNLGGSMDWQATTTGADGAFGLKDVSAEAGHLLFARLDGNGALYAVPSGTSSIGGVDLGTFRLPPAGSISGSVLAVAGGPPVTLELRGPDLRAMDPSLDPRKPAGMYVLTRRQRVDDLGRFRYSDLCAGAYELRIQVKGSPDLVRSLTLASGQDLALEPEDLGGGLEIAGRIQDPDGAPVPGAGVAILIPDQGREASLRTDADGAFRFTRLVAGEYLLAVYPPRALAEKGEEWMPREQQPVQAGDSRVVVVLQRAGWISGVVEESGELKAEFCEIVARNAVGELVASGSAHRNGEFRFLVPAGASLRLEFFPQMLLPGHEEQGIRIRAKSEPAVVLDNVPEGAAGLRVRLPG